MPRMTLCAMSGHFVHKIIAPARDLIVSGLGIGKKLLIASCDSESNNKKPRGFAPGLVR
jgi:hypothetical protein